MFLNRVRVPDFRVLKDVDITFEKEFRRSIFPLGSQNGGGKSTLLQLIFVLLHCWNKPRFLQNMLSGFDIPENTDKRVLAIFNIIDGDLNVELEFFVRPYSWIETITNSAKLEEPLNLKKYNEYLELEQKNIKVIHNITNIGKSVDKKKVVLLCEFKNLEIGQGTSFLKKVSEKIILAAPSTQVFLFLSKDNKKLLFGLNPKDNDSHFSKLIEEESKLVGLFKYDFMFINFVIDVLNNAMDKDKLQFAETREYGNSINKVLKEMNSILTNMELSLRPDSSGVTFKIQRDNEMIEVEPEDLSHGELKRLSIYTWLKYSKIEDAIVLMDELENAFHPDWQSQIIRDLIEWTPSNQYIIATHSYELCEAVPPAYVKELEPKLLPRQ